MLPLLSPADEDRRKAIGQIIESVTMVHSMLQSGILGRTVNPELRRYPGPLST